MRILYFTRDYTVHDQRFLQELAKTENQIGFLSLATSRARESDQSEKAEANDNFRKGASDLPSDEALLVGSTLPPSPVRSLPEAKRLGIEAIPWIGEAVPYSPASLPLFVADLKRVIEAFKPDLIQAGPLHLSAYLVASAGFQPLVSMSWGYDLLFDAPRSQLVQDAIRYTLANSAAMIGDCSTIRQLAISYGMPTEQIVTFPWGIDLDHFRPRPKQSKRRSTSATFTSEVLFRLLSTRGWEPIYGIELLARAFVRAAKVHPELRLVMLGGGSQAGLLNQIFQDSGVREKVLCPGQIDQASLPDYYQAADLYVSASRSDGTSISLLEALACGTPALVSDIPGNREWIEPGVQGWCFHDGDADDLTQAILSIMDGWIQPQGRQKLAQMGRAARRLAEQRADWRINFPQLFKAYDIALHSPAIVNER